MELMVLLTILFTIFKLTGIIDWSWIIVILPFIIGLIVHIGILLIFYLVSKY